MVRSGLGAIVACIVVAQAAAAQTNPTIRPVRPLRPAVVTPVMPLPQQTTNRGPFATRAGDPQRGGVDEIVPPARVAAPVPPPQIQLKTRVYRPSPVILRRGSFRDQAATMPGARRIDLAQLRASPTFNLGATRVDMRPVLSNPRSLINVAGKLQAMPQVARVNVQSLEATEVANGLVIRSFVNYSLKLGTCTDPARRAQVAAAGVRCATQQTDAQRAAAFSTPGNPHYVADGALRAKAIADANAGAAKEAAALGSDVAGLRADLKDPARRAEMVAALGAGEVARIEALDDAGLANEIVNSGDTKVEEVTFVPKSAAVETGAPAPQKLDLTPPPPPADIAQDFPLGTQYYLAGFTLGREYEWRQRIEKTIKRCLLGCSKTYYVEVYAGFNYGLGLRFPLELTGTYSYRQSGASGKESGTLTANFRPIDGTPAQYLAAGLPQEKLFDGKEFVAQFGAYAGFGADLPFYPTLSAKFEAGIDFTQYLPGEFKGGNFTPPTPGGPPLSIPIILYDVDLIGGRANFGIVGAQVFPAARVNLTATGMGLKLTDHNKSDATIPLNPGQSYPVSLNPNTRAGQFAIKDPSYGLAFSIEPGITARLFVDIGVWGHNWDFPVFFPSLAINLGGADFTCHEGTVCSRDFAFAPAADQAANVNLARWANQFETVWLKQCFDDECQKSVRFIRIANQVVMQKQIKDLGGAVPANLDNDPFFKGKFVAANQEAQKAVWLARQRKFNVDFDGTYPGQCRDQPCKGGLALIRGAAQIEFKKIIDSAPPTTGVDLRDTFFNQRVTGARTDAEQVVADSQLRVAGGPAALYGLTAPYELAKQCVDKTCRIEMAVLAQSIAPRGAAIAMANPTQPQAFVNKAMQNEFGPKFAKAIADAKTRGTQILIK